MSDRYKLIISDKKINSLYSELNEKLSEKTFFLGLLDDLVYAYGSVSYQSQKCKRNLDKIKKGMKKHIQDKVLNDPKFDGQSSYMAFPSGETTNGNFLFDLDAYLFFFKRCFDFLAKIPMSFFVGSNIKENEICRMDVGEFISSIKIDSKKYNKVSIPIRRKFPFLVDRFERMEDYIKNIELLRDELTHRKPYKQIFFRAHVSIENKNKWEIISWEFLPKANLNQKFNLADSFKNHVFMSDKTNLEMIVYRGPSNMRDLIVDVLTLIK